MINAPVSLQTLVRMFAESHLLSARYEALVECRRKALDEYRSAVNELTWLEEMAHTLRISLPGAVLLADASKKRYLELDAAVADCQRARAVAIVEQIEAIRHMNLDGMNEIFADVNKQVTEMFPLRH